MDFRNYSLNQFTESLSSKDPVPGGGGASALAAAVGVSLGEMVGSLTVGKKKYADTEADMRVWMEEAEKLRNEFLSLINGDAEAFLPLSEVYRLPKEDPSRGEKMETALVSAAAVPMRLMELCGQGIDLIGRFGEKGSRLAISDAATGAVICRGAMRGAWINLKVNTSAMKDRETAVMLEQRGEELLMRYEQEAELIYEKVMERIG